MVHETQIRLGLFIGLFVVFAVLEAIAPRRTRVVPRQRRWVTNAALVVMDTSTLRLVAVVLPLLAVGAAIDARTAGSGLFNLITLPGWLEFSLAILMFDFAIWAQHLITHKVPLLWRFHRVHHADQDMDVTTAIRFHPMEMAASMLLKIGVVYLIGPAAWAVVVFEVLLNGTALFNHANLRLPLALDSGLRLVLVTPDMHRVHHSTLRAEHDSNYGFALSIWDRLFGTHVPQPNAGHEAMVVGLEWQDDAPTRLGWSLTLPFRRR